MGIGEGIMYSSLTVMLSSWLPVNERTTLACFAFGGSTVRNSPAGWDAIQEEKKLMKAKHGTLKCQIQPKWIQFNQTDFLWFLNFVIFLRLAQLAGHSFQRKFYTNTMTGIWCSISLVALH